MPKKRTWLETHEQPIHWRRAFLSGAAGTLVLLSMVDLCSMWGLTTFSLEKYVGGVFYTGSSTSHWTLGFFGNLLIGGIIGFFYAYCFEYVFKRANVRLGVGLGLGHAIVAACAVFPFFGVLHEQMGLPVNFGFFGSAAGTVTPMVLLLGHLSFGACMGLFYGPVRSDRVRARYHEPGVTVLPFQQGATTEEEDPRDAVYT